MDEGAAIVYETPVPETAGYFSPARVITGVSPASRLVNEETFGPVDPIVAFSTEDEVLDWANNSEYGLVTYLFTRECGRVGIEGYVETRYFLLHVG